MNVALEARQKSTVRPSNASTVNPGRHRRRTAFGDGLAYHRDPLLRRQRRRGLLRIHKNSEDYPGSKIAVARDTTSRWP